MESARKLGFWETTCKFGHDYFAGTSNVVMRANIRGQLIPMHFLSALKLLYHRHPVLRAVIKEQQREWYFFYQENFDHIPVVFLDNNANEFEWHEVVENEMLQQFRQENYLWRVKVLQANQQQQHVIIITFHHATVDGLSTVNFIHELLQIYSQLLQGHTIDLEALSQLPAIEQMLKQKNSWDNFLRHKENSKLQLASQQTWEFHQFQPLAKRVMRNIYCTLSADQVVKLQQQARKQQATINAALNAAMLLAAQYQQGAPLNTTLHTPINLRKYCEPMVASAHLGCYISIVTTAHQDINNTTDFWWLARDYRQQLIDKIPAVGFCPCDFSLSNFDIMELIHLFDMPGSTKRRFFSAGFGISNLGHVQLQSNYGALILDDFMFCTNHVMGEYIIFLHVVTMKDEMRLCFSYAEPLVDKECARLFVNNFMTILQENM